MKKRSEMQGENYFIKKNSYGKNQGLDVIYDE